jgi:beta-1,4-mannosyltransferase
MLNHAIELAGAGAVVDLVGYEGRPLPVCVSEHSRIRSHRVKVSDPAWRHRLPRPLFALHAGWRMTILSLRLLRRLLKQVYRPEYLLVQVPPSVPSLAVALAVSRLRRARLFIDWHNLGHTVLGSRLGHDSWLVRLARSVEISLARRAPVHFCVSAAMQQVLSNDWALRGVRSLYDLPRTQPPRLGADERRSFLRRLSAPPAASDDGGEPGVALAVSATSWSSDEDFGLLLQALPMCEALFVEQALEHGEDPALRLLIVVTGDGPRREAFEAAARSLSLSTIRIATAWLSAEEYPRLLAAADLGLCLHRSTSGLDLPMKVVDMLGAGLPVCALDYGGALGERLRDGENAILFRSAEALGKALHELLRDFPGGSYGLEALRDHIRSTPLPGWREEWRRVAGPLFFPGSGAPVRRRESPLK